MFFIFCCFFGVWRLVGFWYTFVMERREDGRTGGLGLDDIRGFGKYKVVNIYIEIVVGFCFG